MKKLAVVLACAFASTGMAQVGNYLGPGVLSPGAGTIGERSGSAVDLRFFADVNGVYDNGVQPFAVDSKGNLVTISGLYGVQLDAGVYGVHTWKQAVLGLDYSGNFYEYDNGSRYDGTTQSLSLGLTYQKSRRLVLGFRAVAGTSSLGFGSPGFYAPGAPTTVVGQPTSLLFDNRIYYLQSGMNATFIQSSRTSYTFGAEGIFVRRQASGLAGTTGYSASGSIQHRLSRARTIGVEYERLYFEFPPAFGQSNSNVVQGFFATSLSPHWNFAVHGGAFEVNAVGLQQVAISPVIAALLGTSVGTQRFNRTDVYPSGSAAITGQMKNSGLSLAYNETVVPGNGVYLTSRQDSGTLSYSYTGIRKWNFGVSGGYYLLQSIGQGIPKYTTFQGGGGATYNVAKAFHIVARYDARHQDISTLGYLHTGYRVTFGLAFSPGKVPLSLW